MRRTVAVVVAALLLAALSACGGSGTADPNHARVTKILVVVEENHSLDQMRQGMPFTYRLARRFGYATDYRAITHPSLPNYLAMTGGSTFGVHDNGSPGRHRVQGRSVFAEALAHGRTARVYADGMPGTCATSNGGADYAVRHNPWAYYVRERALCRRHDVGLGRLPGDVRHGRLPNVGMVVPNTCHDAHDCSLATADRWFRRLMTEVMRGPDWRSGRLVVVLTADEDDHNQGNTVLTVVAHRGLRHVVVRSPLTHFGLHGLMAEIARGGTVGLRAPGGQMGRDFRLRVG